MKKSSKLSEVEVFKELLNNTEFDRDLNGLAATIRYGFVDYYAEDFIVDSSGTEWSYVLSSDKDGVILDLVGLDDYEINLCKQVEQELIRRVEA